MTRLLQITTSGLALGSLYTLLGLGFVLIYKATGIISFVQPVLMTFGAFFTSYFAVTIGLNFWIAALLAILVVGVLGLVTERAAIRPMVGRPAFSTVMVTIGLFVAMQVVLDDLLGPVARPMGDPWGYNTFDLAGVIVFQDDVVSLLVTAVLVVGLTWFFRHSRLGLAMRATAMNQEAARAQGVSMGSVYSTTWFMAGALAAVAGIFASVGSGVTPETTAIAFLAIPAIILGGLDSVGGSVVGGMLIGLSQAYAFAYQPDVLDWIGENFWTVLPWFVMFLVLVIRPSGLFGTKEIERV